MGLVRPAGLLLVALVCSSPSLVNAAYIELKSSSAAPGQSVAIQATLRTGGRNIVSLQNEIQFPAAAPIGVGQDGKPECLAGGNTQKEGVFTLQPPGCGRRNECERLRVVLAKFQDRTPVPNKTPIPDRAIIYICRVDVAPGAAAGTELPFRCLSGKGRGPNGETIDLECRHGSIRVSSAAPVATRTRAPTFTPTPTNTPRPRQSPRRTPTRTRTPVPATPFTPTITPDPRVKIEAARSALVVQETTEFKITVQTVDRRPIAGASVILDVGPGLQARLTRTSTDQNGTVEGTLTATAVGDNRLGVLVILPSQERINVSSRFRVVSRASELTPTPGDGGGGDGCQIRGGDTGSGWLLTVLPLVFLVWRRRRLTIPGARRAA